VRRGASGSHSNSLRHLPPAPVLLPLEPPQVHRRHRQRAVVQGLTDVLHCDALSFRSPSLVSWLIPATRMVTGRPVLSRKPLYNTDAVTGAGVSTAVSAQTRATEARVEMAKDFREYQRALVALLRLVEALGLSKAQVADHLRYQASHSSPLVGSDLGSKIWQSEESRTLVSVLLSHKTLGRWFAPPPDSRLNELRSQIGSLVQAWGEKGGTPEEVARELGERFLQAVRDPAPAGSWARVLYGVQTDQRLDLPCGSAVAPITAEQIQGLVESTGGREVDILRVPKEPAVIAYASATCRRDQMGAFAGTTAFGMAYVMIEQLRLHIWLATGVLPRIGDGFTIPASAFPVVPAAREPASLQEMHAHRMDWGPATIDPTTLRDVDERMATLHGHYEDFPEELLGPLRVANAFLRPAVDTPDPVMTLLLAYAAIDGLLLERTEDDSQLGPRWAALIQRDEKEGRRIRKAVERWRDIRGFVAHGDRPPVGLVASFLDGSVSDEELQVPWPGLGRASRSRAGRAFRRAFLAFLWCSVAVRDGVARPDLQRDEVLTLLRRAGACDKTSVGEIQKRVPQWVRDIGL